MSSMERESIVLEAELRSAMTQGGLSLHYQPQVCLDNGDIIGMEALMRWSHRTRGMIPPGRLQSMLNRREWLN